MNQLKLIGERKFQTGNRSDFIVYYYIHINEAAKVYGIRLEKRFQNHAEAYEYAEEKQITSSKLVAEELAKYLMDYEVTPISLPETLDDYWNKKE